MESHDCALYSSSNPNAAIKPSGMWDHSADFPSFQLCDVWCMMSAHVHGGKQYSISRPGLQGPHASIKPKGFDSNRRVVEIFFNHSHRQTWHCYIVNNDTMVVLLAICAFITCSSSCIRRSKDKHEKKNDLVMMCRVN